MKTITIDDTNFIQVAQLALKQIRETAAYCGFFNRLPGQSAFNACRRISLRQAHGWKPVLMEAKRTYGSDIFRRRGLITNLAKQPPLVLEHGTASMKEAA